MPCRVGGVLAVHVHQVRILFSFLFFYKNRFLLKIDNFPRFEAIQIDNFFRFEAILARSEIARLQRVMPGAG